MAKKKARDKPLQSAAWLRRHLERLDRAGPRVEDRVLAGIAAWVDDYLNPSSWNPGYGDAIKAAARDNLFGTSSEDRARALSKFWGLFERAARWVGEQDRVERAAYTARGGNVDKRKRLRGAAEQAMKKYSRPTRGIGYARKIRSAVLEELSLSADTADEEWPTARAIQVVVTTILDEQGVPGRTARRPAGQP
jgi:hypothetical protein